MGERNLGLGFCKSALEVISFAAKFRSIFCLLFLKFRKDCAADQQYVHSIATYPVANRSFSYIWARFPSLGQPITPFWLDIILAFLQVAYLDPGNWATAIEGGSRFGYDLIWVVVVSNLIAILLQVMAARLGIVSGKHLAEVCREQYPSSLCFFLWCLSEISIIALDLTMVLGSAAGMNLLFGIPLLPCILLTSLDFLAVLFAVPKIGRYRLFELLTVCIVGTVLACFVVELCLSQPTPSLVLAGFIPNLDRQSIYTAVSLLGANVMPHNFYLHSALVKGRHSSNLSIKYLCRMNLIDVALAFGVALLINLAVLVLSASTFYSAGVVVETLQDAHDFMEQLLSNRIAPVVFGMALLLTSQLSTFTETISGQVVLQGFLNLEIKAWIRRLVTRSLAILNAATLQHLYGDKGTYKMLVITQVVLALLLPFTLVPLIKATSDRKLMGPFVNSGFIQLLAWASTLLIFIVNLCLCDAVVLPPISGFTLLSILGREPVYESWSNALIKVAATTGVLCAIGLLIWMIATPFSFPEKDSIEPLIVTVDSTIAQQDQTPRLDNDLLDLDSIGLVCRLADQSDLPMRRSSRKAFVAALEDFWSPLYDLHGTSLVHSLQPDWTARLYQCLLSIYRLENSSVVLRLEDIRPWQSINRVVLSSLHSAFGFQEVQCPYCHAAIDSSAQLSVVSSREMDSQRSLLFVFGLWSMRRLILLCSTEPRPELWGKYGRVLNRLQWLLPHFPCSVDDSFISKETVLEIVDNLEEQIVVKRGPKGTRPALTAYPKVLSFRSPSRSGFQA